MDTFKKFKKKKSILTHLFIKIINLIKNEDQSIMYNVLFNQINTNYKYTENKNGKYIIIGKDGGISRQLYVNGEYNLQTLRKTINIVGKLDLIVDVGANIGSNLYISNCK